jgi:hypothetical protein
MVFKADDFIIGFEHKEDAGRFLTQLRQRLERFKFQLHPDKTRLIRFGRLAAQRRDAVDRASPKLSDSSASPTSAA